jgi:peptide subunit release factor RF-3
MTGTFISGAQRRESGTGREPLELIDEIKSELGLTCWPVNWPIGSGDVILLTHAEQCC